MPTALITGTNRGLGLGFTQEFAELGWRVFACCRVPEKATELAEIAKRADKVSTHRLDVADPAQIDALAKELKGQPVDLLINNAGIYGSGSVGNRNGFGDVDYDMWMKTFKVNVLGPMRMAEAFVENLANSDRRLIVTITSKMGSIADNTSGGAYDYRSSKAAVNSVMKSVACDLADRGITSVLFHPGWVRTDMGTDKAPLDIKTSTHSMVGVIEKLSFKDSGRFLNYDGTEVAW